MSSEKAFSDGELLGLWTLPLLLLQVRSSRCLRFVSIVLRADLIGRWWLFDGAAVSAFFVVIIVALTVLLALRYMLLTRRSLCHPRSSFGRGLMVATGLFAALHFVNIGTHVSPLSDTCSVE